MRRIGISNSHSKGYKFTLVTDMLDKNSPLIIYSVPGINIFKAHAWNLDGYKVRTREVTVKKYKDNALFETIIKQENSEMVHCDFGWGGSGNGYYVSGVFKVNKGELDGTKADHSTNYNHLLKVITYDKL
ncbi:MAG: C10 family peptidase [Duncaniella sp.]|nr:C10 family peptidase [Muribaculum sp.]MCM1254858.1 C10 family peptidase [Duncaniella sp.]